MGWNQDSDRAADDGGRESGRVTVLLPLPLAGPLDYRADGQSLAPGNFVTVPLGGRQVVGVVWDGPGAGKAVAAARLKPVTARLPLPGINAVHRRFLTWVAAYNLAPPGLVLKMAMSVPSAFEPAPLRRLYAHSGPPPARMTPERQRFLEMALGSEPRSVKDWCRLAYVGEGVVRGLIDSGTLVAVDVPADAPYAQPDLNRPGLPLSAQQQAAVRGILAGDGYAPTLLEGVTGSGKTEVYFELIAARLKDNGGQALVLLPEIALTAQWLQRFRERFGVSPVLWHSDLGEAERRRAWTAVLRGEARVVVGARSALFLPFPDLKLIVVDEEHDPAFKQDEGVTYQARDMAVVRAHLGKIPVVLASATPSLETLYNVNEGRYRRFSLPDRHGVAELPDITAIDMRRTPPPPGGFLSPPLRQALQETVAAGEQGLLFLNRRGYAPLTLCRACGHRLECPHCTAWMVEHRYAGRLQCHHCGHMMPPPDTCPHCGAPHQLVPCGPGVERVAEEVAALQPDARVLVLSSDQATSAARFGALIDDIESHRVDIVIGTQIVTKGYHFPKLTLVGVVDADLGLAGGDLRAAERTYQQLSQVAGRAGREALKGRVLLQSYLPEHPVLAALVKGDKEAFLAAEMAERAQQNAPPYGRWAAIIVSSEDADAVARMARRLGATAPRGGGITVIGPAPAPMALLRGRHRWRLLLKATRAADVQQALRSWLQRAGEQKGVRVQVDVDPYGFM